MGLPLNKKIKIDHTQLSQFRSSLTFSQLVNLLVYVLHHFFQSGLLGDFSLHGVDSTELANFCKTPLASVKINGKKIRIYNDLDCDCGKRRKKRDKSDFVVGYRLHVLTAIDAKTGHSFPLVSMLAPANHHDSLFLKPLVQLAQAMGIDLKLISADEAYNDKDGSLQEMGVRLITPASSKAKLPENVDAETKAVMCNEFCEIPMQRVGSGEGGHEFKCAANSGECFRSEHVQNLEKYLLIAAISSQCFMEVNMQKNLLVSEKMQSVLTIYSKIRPGLRTFVSGVSMRYWHGPFSAT